MDPSSEGLSVVGGPSAEPVPAADRSVSAEDRVLVAVQLGLRHHQAGVVVGAAVFDTCMEEDGVTGCREAAEDLDCLTPRSSN